MTDNTDLQKLLAKVTKGPWRVEENTTWIWGNCIPEDNSSWGMGFPVAEAVLRNYGWNRDAISPEIAQANARLIAMAPDLAARVIELEDQNARLREGRDKLIKAGEAVCEGFANGEADKALLWDLATTIAALKGGEV